MYLHNISRFPQEELVKRLRSIQLLGDPDIFPYRNAHIEIRLADPSTLQPGSLYVLRFHLSFLALLLDRIWKKTGGAYAFDTLFEYTDEFGDMYNIAPPIVEWVEDCGQWMLVDGEHRCYIARHRGISLPVIFISGVDPRALYPFQPLPRGWDSVKCEDVVPEQKHLFRPEVTSPEEYRKLFKDLRPLGSGGMRAQGSRS